MNVHANHTCNYGKCMTAICAASDSNMTTKKCWCPECKEIRVEIRANVAKLNSKAIAKFVASQVGA